MAGPNTITGKALSAQIDPSKNTKFRALNQSRAAELKKACQDFESVFVNQMFQEMRKTVSKDGLFDGGRAEEIYTSMQDAELAKTMSRQRGLGLADIMYRQLSEMYKLDGDGENKK